MVSIYNISDWNKKQWLSTTGSRNKFIIENPENNKLYYFKESIAKYPAEFWSEIIASKLGQYLKINIVDYNIGISEDNLVGCICESMITEEEELIHGINLIKNEIPDFKVSDRPIVTFQDIYKVLTKYRGFIRKFIDMLIFDSLIGNQDRHSENWALIRKLNDDNFDSNKKKMFKFFIEIYKKYKINLPFKTFFQKTADRLDLFDYKFSPVYDSGSSLGREIDEYKIHEFNENKIKSYIKKGNSEIRWNNLKINHFELLKKIDNELYQHYIKSRIEQLCKNYNEREFKEVIFNIDINLESKYNLNKLSLQRKNFINNLIKYRIEILKKEFSVEN